MTGSTFESNPGGQPSSCSMSGPDEHGMYTLSVNEPFFPGRPRDGGFQEQVMQRLESSAPSLEQGPAKRFYGRDDREDHARMAELAYGSPRDSAIVRDFRASQERQR
jgi:hypothetical protein